MKKKVLITFAVALFGVVAIRAGARFFLDRVDACAQPCRWLGSREGYASCPPLEVRLEIRTTSQPQGGIEAVWYRASVANRSCETIQVPAEFFMYNRNPISRDRLSRLSALRPEWEPPLGSSLVIRDARGRELPENRDANALGVRGAGSDIKPYGRDVSSLEPMLHVVDRPAARPGDKRSDSVLEIPPGGGIAASPTILWPHRMVVRESESPDYVGASFVPQAVDMPDAAERFASPPPGFRRMEEYELNHPGIYTAEFVFDDNTGIQIRRRVASHPGWAKKALRFLAGVDGKPRLYDDFLKVRASSGKVSFEVKR